MLTSTKTQLYSGLRFLGVSLALSLVASTAQAASFSQVPNGAWSTGFSASNTLLATNTPGTVDPHYTLIKTPAGCAGLSCQEDNSTSFGPSTYVVIGPAPAFPFNGSWLADTSLSSWIGPRSDQHNPSTTGTTFPNVAIYASATDFYVYRLIFDFAALGLDPTTANIQLKWLSDNSDNGGSPLLQSSIRLCGVTSVLDPVCAIGTTVPSSTNSGQSAGALTPVSITSGFSQGKNALDFIVYNSPIAFGLNPSGVRVQIQSATAAAVQTGVPEPASFLMISVGLIATGVGLRRRKLAAMAVNSPAATLVKRPKALV